MGDRSGLVQNSSCHCGQEAGRKCRTYGLASSPFILFNLLAHGPVLPAARAGVPALGSSENTVADTLRCLPPRYFSIHLGLLYAWVEDSLCGTKQL